MPKFFPFMVSAGKLNTLTIFHKKNSIYHTFNIVSYHKLNRADMKNLLFKLMLILKTFFHRLYITLQMYGENGLANHAAACAYGFLLSMAPMLLLVAFLIFFIFGSSPRAIIALIGTIPFLGN
jgi:membrane protein